MTADERSKSSNARHQISILGRHCRERHAEAISVQWGQTDAGVQHETCHCGQGVRRRFGKYATDGNEQIDEEQKPEPIKVANWKKLLEKARGEDRAMILCMLNFCMYAGEVVSVKWAELDFNENTMVSRRKKRGEFIKVATLWPETVKALNVLDRSRGPYVFMASGGAAKGNPLRKEGACNRLHELINEAELVGVIRTSLHAFGMVTLSMFATR
jgi:integrase